MSRDDEFHRPYISTGHLPDPEVVERLVREAYARFRTNDEGVVSQVYPALARMPRDLFGLCVVGTSGRVYAAGEVEHEFSIMSVSKPFIFALVCELIGPSEARARLGANATGRPFNSLAAIEEMPGGLTNPMVNAGAIATTSLVPGATGEEKWKFIHDGLSRFAGRTLSLNEEVYACALETNFRNRAIARMLQSLGRIYCDPVEAIDLYTRQCSLNVSARDLAVMGATLADGGVNPINGERVVDRASAITRSRSWRRRASTRRPATGSTRSACRARAASAAASSPSRRARAGSALSRRRWTARATASRASAPPAFSPSVSAWIFSSPRPADVTARRSISASGTERHWSVVGFRRVAAVDEGHPLAKARNSA